MNSVAVSCTHRTIVGSAFLLTPTHRLVAIVNSPESHFGHDRANNDSKFVFPVYAVTVDLITYMKFLVFGL